MAYVRDTAVAVPTNAFSGIPFIRKKQVSDYRANLSVLSNVDNWQRLNSSNAAQSGSSAKSENSSSYGYYATPVASSASSVDYLDADLAKHYGMDAKTAYQEALANTAIRRQMADLKAAGLNPVLAANYGGSSSSVYNPTLQSEVTAGNSSIYSGGSGSSRSSAKSGKSLLSNKNVQSAIASLGSLAVSGAVGSRNPAVAFQAGAAAYYGIQGAFQSANALEKFYS